MVGMSVVPGSSCALMRRASAAAISSSDSFAWMEKAECQLKHRRAWLFDGSLSGIHTSALQKMVNAG